MRELYKVFITVCLVVVSNPNMGTGQTEKEKNSEPPSWLTKDSIEVRVPEHYLYADTNDPVPIDLGKLHVAIPYYVKVPFTNMSSNDVSVKDLATSCGCIGARRIEELVKINQKSHFVVLLKPRQKAERFAQKVTVKFDKGPEWLFVIKGEVVADYVCDQNTTKQKTANQEYDLMIRQTEDARQPLMDLQVRSSHGFLRIDTATVKDSVMRLKVHAGEKQRITLVEGIQLLNKQGTLVGEVELVIEPERDLFSIPEKIPLVRKDDTLTGTATLVGDRGFIKQFPDEASVELKGGLNLPGVIRLKRRTEVSLFVEFEFSVKGASPIELDKGEAFLRINNQVLGEPLKFELFEM